MITLKLMAVSLMTGVGPSEHMSSEGLRIVIHWKTGFCLSWSLSNLGNWSEMSINYGYVSTHYLAVLAAVLRERSTLYLCYQTSETCLTGLLRSVRDKIMVSLETDYQRNWMWIVGVIGLRLQYMRMCWSGMGIESNSRSLFFVLWHVMQRFCI